MIASVPRRAAAYLLDLFVVGSGSTLLLALIGSVVDLPAGDPAGASARFAILTAIVSLAWFVGGWLAPWAGTPVQLLLRVRVGRAAAPAARLSPAAALVRWLALGQPLLIVAALPGLAGFASLALVGWSLILLGTANGNDRRQGLHDRLAGSVVTTGAHR